MPPHEIASRFCAIVNQALAGLQAIDDPLVLGECARQALLDSGALDDEAPSLVDPLVTSFRAAAQPSAFRTERITGVDTLFDLAYDLLRVTFDRDVLASRERFAGWYAEPDRSRTSLWLCRTFTVPGLHQYDENGSLREFGFDPRSATRGVAATLSGSLMDLEGVPGDAIAGIGYAATRPAFRRQKHGLALVDAFEQEMHRTAASAGKTLRMIILEAESRARPFWAGCGYRCPSGSRYLQPPIEFDLQTGDKLFDEVPEQIMVKVFDPDPAHVDSRLLETAVQTIYANWYAARAANPRAEQRIRDYIFGDLLDDFRDSIRAWGEKVPLVLPDCLSPSGDRGF